ncbi:hypothetical protein IQ22_04365 [Pseudomonas duriflava]|uniref:Uncharacterized protein n=1 Tax=Pseudomonas duriflava TaxID=459528 RepID=A0A562PRV6_9PSED|nr:hypothetical protein [Pseudomonas duriflava]TWI47093.1 hypothetical protein IQ22_04365 [Pseudomonas duriflava]
MTAKSQEKDELQEAIEALARLRVRGPALLKFQQQTVSLDPHDPDLQKNLIAHLGTKARRLINFTVGQCYTEHGFPIFVAANHRKCVFGRKSLAPDQIISVEVIETLTDEDRQLFPWEELQSSTLFMVAVKLVTAYRPALYLYLNLNKPISRDTGMYQDALARAQALCAAIQRFKDLNRV